MPINKDNNTLNNSGSTMFLIIFLTHMTMFILGFTLRKCWSWRPCKLIAMLIRLAVVSTIDSADFLRPVIMEEFALICIGIGAQKLAEIFILTLASCYDILSFKFARIDSEITTLFPLIICQATYDPACYYS